jgi:hypothetical protein
MQDADMTEVYKRLGEKGAKLLDESHREMPLPEDHWGETPLFEREGVRIALQQQD